MYVRKKRFISDIEWFLDLADSTPGASRATSLPIWSLAFCDSIFYWFNYTNILHKQTEDPSY